jgi:hypothetical protein
LGEGGRGRGAQPDTQGDIFDDMRKYRGHTALLEKMAVARGVSRPFWNVVEYCLWNTVSKKKRVKCQDPETTRTRSDCLVTRDVGWLKIQHDIFAKPGGETVIRRTASSDFNAMEEAPQSELMGAGKK